MKPLNLVVVGIASCSPYAGMAWMHMQIVLGLLRLGHKVHYFEIASQWPYDPGRKSLVGDSHYSVQYIDRLTKEFGIPDRWAYRRSYSDKAWFGLSRGSAESLLSSADAVINVSGATDFRKEELRVGPLVYLGTDPVEHEIGYFNGNATIRALIDQHDLIATYGENIGTPYSPIPPLPGLRAHTRPAILLDFWKDAPESKGFTTICNWSGAREVDFRGEKYFWSKDREFMKFVDLPQHIQEPVELAVGLSSMSEQVQELLRSKGWNLTDGHAISLNPWPYRDYICSSAGEFTVAKDQNVRLRSGWFSERSACYLAAGRPVITQNTGFGTVLPTGEGLFAFDTLNEILTGFEAIRSDYQRHSRAARAIAQEYFRAETVLSKLLSDFGL